MFADHGVVHVRDVATGLVRLIDTIDGVLLPGRPASRRRFVEVIGVAMTYLHDIGMVDMTPDGRRDHAVFASHAAFGPDVAPLVDHLLAPGPVRGRLDEIVGQAPFATSLEIVVREILAMTVAHSKSAVPAAVLDDRASLRRLMQRVVFTSLDDHRAHERRPSAEDGSPVRFDANTDGYADPAQSFAWLDAPGGPHAALADDVIDAVRALRAADVLRQRGTGLRTSGGFEVCMDAVTAKAVCTLRPASRERGLRDHVRRRAWRGRGEHPRRVRDAARAPPHRVPPRRVRQRGCRAPRRVERRGRHRRHPGGRHPVVHGHVRRRWPHGAEPIRRRRADPARAPGRQAGLRRRGRASRRRARSVARPATRHGRRRRGRCPAGTATVLRSRAGRRDRRRCRRGAAPPGGPRRRVRRARSGSRVRRGLPGGHRTRRGPRRRRLAAVVRVRPDGPRADGATGRRVRAGARLRRGCRWAPRASSAAPSGTARSSPSRRWP